MKKVLAFDIGATNTRLALINEHFDIEKEIVTPTPRNDAEKFMQNCVEMIQQFSLENVIAIGAGLPGTMDYKTGLIFDLPNVHISNVEFGKILKEKFNLPVFVRNDAQVACLSEAYIGAGKKFKRVFFITISSGLGAALCVDKVNQDYLTDIGRTLFMYKNQLIMYEQISGLNIKKFAEMNGEKIEGARDLFSKAKTNPESVKNTLDQFLFVLNKFIDLIRNSYHPEIITFTGGLMHAKELFFDKIKELNPDIYMTECALGENAGIVGAAIYAFKCAK